MATLSKIAMGVFFIIVGCAPAIAQDTVESPEKAALINALNEIQDRARSIREAAGNSNLSEVTDKLLTSAQSLARSAEQWSPKKPGAGQAFLNSVERMLQVLRGAPASGAELEALLVSVSDDLEIKKEYCVVKGLATPVEVKVVTKRNGLDEVKGLKVFYIEKFFQSDPNGKPQEFRGFSSPAVDSLVPGRYVFWAKEPGGAGRNGERKEVPIRGLSSESIEVLTP